MIVKTFPCEPFATNSYLVRLENRNECFLIDPSKGSYELFLQYIEEHKLIPKAILLTHSHWDHIVDVAKCKNFWNLSVYLHKNDEKNLLAPGSDGLPMMVAIEASSVDDYLEDGQILDLAGFLIEVIHTPGHTPGGVCFYLKNQGALFSGDTLFKGSIGNISFPTSEPEKMWLSLKKLIKLPSLVKVYPGHGDSTMIGEEPWLEKAEQIFG